MGSLLALMGFGVLLALLGRKKPTGVPAPLAPSADLPESSSGGLPGGSSGSGFGPSCSSPAVIRAVQTKLGVVADGIWGPLSSAALTKAGLLWSDLAGPCDGDPPEVAGAGGAAAGEATRLSQSRANALATLSATKCGAAAGPAELAIFQAKTAHTRSVVQSATTVGQIEAAMSDWGGTVNTFC